MEEKQTKRWIEDVGVDPIVRQTIAAARDEGPNAASLERVTKGVVAGLGVGTLGPAGGVQGQPAAGAPPAAAVSAGQVGLVTWATVAAVICGVSAIIGTQMFGGGDDDKSPAPAARAPEPREPAPAPRATTPETETLPAASKAEPARPKAAAEDVKPTSAPALKSTSAKPRTREIEHDPAEEVRLLRQAKRALSDAPSEALRMAREHERRFGEGTFGQEREALAIEALHEIGQREEALRSLKRFRRRWPRSVYMRRIEERLGIAERVHE